jgi:branched-chain amino acid transport system ATP-binding protein
MLKVEHLDVAYGDLQVLWDLSFEMKPGSIVALLGPNGAGKTTTLKAISGLMHPIRGEIYFKDNRIDGQPSHEIVNLGLSLVPEWKGVFYSLTVRENLEMGAYPEEARSSQTVTMAEIFKTFPILEERQNQKARTLSGGERQMLGIGRALMSKPKLLILDEPSLGLAPLLVKEIFNVIQRINDEGVAVLLVEQNTNSALKIASYAYIIEQGRIVGEGTGDELLQDQRVVEAYLGT